MKHEVHASEESLNRQIKHDCLIARRRIQKERQLDDDVEWEQVQWNESYYELNTYDRFKELDTVGPILLPWERK